MQNKKVVIISIVALLILFVGGIYAYKANEASKLEKLANEQASLFQRPYSYTVGNANAKVKLVEFFDPACGTCASFHPEVKKIMKDANGEIQLILRYAPFHRGSNYAVKMLEGAREQGKFMETLEFMFSTQGYWTENHVVNPNKLFRMLANVKGLDMNKLGTYMNENKSADEIIKQDLADAEELGATKTPSYFVNGKALENFGLQNLKDLINSEL